MNSKLVKASLAGTAAVALVISGGTLAAWSDNFTDDGNTVGAGELTLNVVQETGNGPKMGFDNVRLAPADGKDEYVLVSSNDGNSVPNGILQVTIQDLTDDENGCQNNGERDAEAGACDAPGDTGEFSENARIKLTAYRATDTNPNLPGVQKDCGNNVAGGGEYSGTGTGKYTAIASQTLDAADAAGPHTFKVSGTGADMVLAPGDALCVGASIVLPGTTGNEVQGDSSSFDLYYELIQTSQDRDANAGV